MGLENDISLTDINKNSNIEDKRIYRQVSYLSFLELFKCGFGDASDIINEDNHHHNNNTTMSLDSIPRLIGKTFIMQSFISTTHSMKAIQWEENKGEILQLIIEDARGYHIGDISKFKKESEFLLPNCFPGVLFRVKKIDKKNEKSKRHIVTLQALDDGIATEFRERIKVDGHRVLEIMTPPDTTDYNEDHTVAKRWKQGEITMTIKNQKVGSVKFKYWEDVDSVEHGYTEMYVKEIMNYTKTCPECRRFKFTHFEADEEFKNCRCSICKSVLPTETMYGCPRAGCKYLKCSGCSKYIKHVGTHLLSAAIVTVHNWCKVPLKEVKLRSAFGANEKCSSVLATGPVPFYVKFGFDFRFRNEKDRNGCEPTIRNLDRLVNRFCYAMILYEEGIQKVIENYSLDSSPSGEKWKYLSGIHGNTQPVYRNNSSRTRACSEHGNAEENIRIKCRKCYPIPTQGSMWENPSPKVKLARCGYGMKWHDKTENESLKRFKEAAKD